MKTWVVGDIHGWLDVFDRLLRKIDLDVGRDRLWLVGDLVNRGPDSAGVLRRARQLEARMGERFQSVLGNHDLHLFSTNLGVRDKSGDALAALLDGDDSEELLDWLRRRPLMFRGTVRHKRGLDRKIRKKKGKKGKRRTEEVVVVHAGLWPHWTVENAARRARKLEKILRRTSKKGTRVRQQLLAIDKSRVVERYGKKRSRLPKLQRRARDLYAFTHLRMLDRDGRPTGYSGPPEQAPQGQVPWYAAAERQWAGVSVIFGHWAAHDVRQGDDWISLDSGCSWGRKLTAIRLENRKVVQVKNKKGPL